MSLSPGKYRAIATSHRVGKTEPKNGEEGKAFVSAEMKVTEGELMGETAEWTGWLTPKAMARTISTLQTMGMVGDNVLDMQLDQEVMIVVDEDNFTGTPRMRVKWINPITKALPPDQAAAIAAEVRAAIAKSKGPIDPFADAD